MSAIEYATLAEAKSQLRIPHDDEFDDEHIILLIRAASGAIKNYLNDFSAYQGERNSDDDYVVDSNYEPVLTSPRVVKPEVRMAALLLVGKWYRDREAGSEDGNMLPGSVKALLSPLRDPVMR